MTNTSEKTQQLYQNVMSHGIECRMKTQRCFTKRKDISEGETFPKRKMGSTWIHASYNPTKPELSLFFFLFFFICFMNPKSTLERIMAEA